MGFRKEAYAKVWEINDNKTYANVKLSISRKNKETGEYETDFSGFVSFVGDAYKDIKKKRLREEDRIQLGGCDVTTYKAKDGTYKYHFTVFDWTIPEK